MKLNCKSSTGTFFGSTITIVDLQTHISNFEKYLLFERVYSAHTVKAYIADTQLLNRFILKRKEIQLLEDITSTLLERFLLYLKRRQINASSQARHLTGLRSFFSYLIHEKLIKRNPVKYLESPKITSSSLPKTLSTEEIDGMLNSLSQSNISQRRARAMISMMYSSGIRVSELLNFRWSNYQYKKGYIKVDGKGNKERLIPIGYQTIFHINKYIVKDRINQLPISYRYNDHLFLNDKGKPLSRSEFRNLVEKTAELAGIKRHVTPHMFRHSFATHMLDGGAPIHAVKDMLGHESVTTTEIYTKLDIEFLHDTINLFHPRSPKQIIA